MGDFVIIFYSKRNVVVWPFHQSLAKHISKKQKIYLLSYQGYKKVQIVVVIFLFEVNSTVLFKSSSQRSIWIIAAILQICMRHFPVELIHRLLDSVLLFLFFC